MAPDHLKNMTLEKWDHKTNFYPDAGLTRYYDWDTELLTLCLFILVRCRLKEMRQRRWDAKGRTTM